MKKILALSILLMIVLAFTFTSCINQGELTSREKYEKIFEASEQLESVKMEFDGVMSMDVDMGMDSVDEASAAGMEMMADMLKNIKFTGSGEYMKTDTIGDLAMVYQVNLNGITMEIELYFDGDKLIVNYPMMPKYIVIDMNEVLGMANETGELGFELDYETIIANLDTIMEDYMRISKEVVFENIRDEDIEIIEEYSFTFKGEETKTEALKVNVRIDNMADYMKSFFVKAKDVESFRSIMDLFNTEEEVTMEVYNAYIDEALAEMEASEAEMLSAYDNMTINQYDIVIGYDKDFNITDYDAIMSYDLYDENSEMNMNFSVNMNSILTNHNSITEVTIPEIDEENSMGFTDLMGDTY
jgi:hypothetical protein